MQMSLDDLTRTITVNLTGAFLCCRAVLRAMRARGSGRIVLISSMLARNGAANGADYAASKGGILGLARSLALEVAGDGIRVNTVSPGVVDTAMPRAHSTDEMLAAIGKTNPLGRIAVVDDVAEACLFLLGEDSSYLTGQDLRVNGGATLW
jgi:NAD(P)-dependent dehydrogenase (short-subunit alcohol dehydrogenase family)